MSGERCLPIADIELVVIKVLALFLQPALVPPVVNAMDLPALAPEVPADLGPIRPDDPVTGPSSCFTLLSGFLNQAGIAPTPTAGERPSGALESGQRVADPSEHPG